MTYPPVPPARWVAPQMVEYDDFPDSTLTTEPMLVLEADRDADRAQAIIGVPYAEKSGRTLHLALVLPPDAAPWPAVRIQPLIRRLAEAGLKSGRSVARGRTAAAVTLCASVSLSRARHMGRPVRYRATTRPAESRHCCGLSPSMRRARNAALYASPAPLVVVTSVSTSGTCHVDVPAHADGSMPHGAKGTSRYGSATRR